MQNFITDINTACRCMTYRKHYWPFVKTILLFGETISCVYKKNKTCIYNWGDYKLSERKRGHHGGRDDQHVSNCNFLLLLEINDGPLGVIFYKSDVNRFQYIWTLPVREGQDHRQGSWPTYHLMPIDTKKQDYSIV